MGRMALVGHFAMIPPLRTYLFDTGAVPRYFTLFFFFSLLRFAVPCSTDTII